MAKIEKVIAWPFYFLALIVGLPAIALSLTVAYLMDWVRHLVSKPFDKQILKYQKEISEILDAGS